MWVTSCAISPYWTFLLSRHDIRLFKSQGLEASSLAYQDCSFCAGQTTKRLRTWRLSSVESTFYVYRIDFDDVSKRLNLYLIDLYRNEKNSSGVVALTKQLPGTDQGYVCVIDCEHSFNACPSWKLLAICEHHLQVYSIKFSQRSSLP